MNENDGQRFSNNEKYFEKENSLFDKYLEPTNFCGYPVNERLHKKHEFYLNEPRRVHASYDLRKFENWIKKERREQNKAERLEKKKQSKAKKIQNKETILEEKPVIIKEEPLVENLKENKEEAFNNEFKLDERANQILQKIAMKPKKVADETNEINIIRLEAIKLKAFLEKQELDERKSKMEKYLRFLNNNKMDENFLIRNLNQVPFLPKQFLLENKNLYSNSEIQLSDTKLFEASEKIFTEKLIPSVSNIIQLANPFSENLLKWKLEKVQTLGMEGFNIYSQNIKKEGQKFHMFVEKRLLNKQVDLYDQKLEALDPILKKIQAVLLTEAPVQHSNLFYQGRIDCLAYYENELCLIDWKCSEKSKKDLKDLYDLPVQISAYIGAFLSDPRYEQLRKSHQIKKGLLVNFNKLNGDVNLHFINFHLSEFYWYKWLNYLRDFWINILKNRN